MPQAAYRLVVDGELSDRVGVAFEGMTLTREDGRTALTGPVRDQAQLQGLLRRIADLGLTLLTVNVVEDEPLARAVAGTAPKGRRERTPRSPW